MYLAPRDANIIRSAHRADLMAVAVAVAILAAAWVVGQAYGRNLQRSVLRRLPRDTSGIILGAGDIVRPGTNGAAVLLIHGAGDTPQTLTHVADELNRRGYTAFAPLLPGHGRSLSALAASSSDDWYARAGEGLVSLRREHEWVGVMGLSMGGALAARIAAEHRDVPALVLASPFLKMQRFGNAMTVTSWLWGPFVPFVNTSSDHSVLDPRARIESRGYGVMSVSSLRELRRTAYAAWRALPAIQSPTLIIQSTKDNRVSSDDTKGALERIGAQEKRLDWIEGSGHVITVDFGWEGVTASIADWMDAHHATRGRGSTQ